MRKNISGDSSERSQDRILYKLTHGRGKKVPSKKKVLLKRFHLIGHTMLDIGLNTKALPSFSKLWIFPAAIQSSEVIEQE